MSIALTGLLSIAMAVVFSGSIKAVWKTLGSYSAGCLLLPMLIAYFKKEWIEERIFTWSTTSSALGITLWRFYEIKIFDDLYVGLIISGIIIFFGACTVDNQSQKNPS